MTTITVAVPSWEDVDARLAALQGEVRWGTLAAQGKALVAVLAEVRGDLAVLRALAGVVEVAAAPEPRETAGAVQALPLASPAPSATAVAHGFTGDPCQECGQLMLVPNGTCFKCMGCGATTGCS